MSFSKQSSYSRGRKMVEMALKTNSDIKSLKETEDGQPVVTTPFQENNRNENGITFETDEKIFEACDTAINRINDIMIVDDIPREYSELLHMVEDGDECNINNLQTSNPNPTNECLDGDIEIEQGTPLSRKARLQKEIDSDYEHSLNESHKEDHTSRIVNGVEDVIIENQMGECCRQTINIKKSQTVNAINQTRESSNAQSNNKAMLVEKENDPDYEISSNDSHREEEEPEYYNKRRYKTALQEKWETNITKKLRMEGEEYQGYQRSKDGVVKKGVPRPARQISLKCDSTACKKMKNRHCSKFSDNERSNIFNSFWKHMNWEEKKVYVTSNIEYLPKKRNSVGENSRRSGTFNYFLRKIDNTKLQVCKKMFLGTMGLKEDMVQDWMRNTEHGINTSSKLIKDDRKVNNQKRDKLKEFFDSLPKMPSHYCRKESSKLYLEQFFQTKQELYRQYKNYCEKNSFPELILSNPVFDKGFSDMNLALYQPRKDRCDTCCGYETKNISEEEYQAHLRKKDRARQEKTHDKELARQGQVYTFCMDMQAVKICPVVNASKIYYKTKLSVHNFTIYDMDSHICRNYWFNESEGDLSASTFASCVIDFIKDKCTKKIPITLYSDGCSYQNRNAILSNALLNYSIKNQITIQQKYLEKGHTQMECDAVHSLIERKLQKRIIELPSDYVKITQEARTKPLQLEAVYLTHDFFLNYADQKTWIYNSIRPGKKVNDPTVTDLRHLNYNFEKRVIEYKINFADELQALPERALKYPDVDYNSLHTSRLKIKKTKWQHLQEIKSVLSKDCHSFYDNLPF